jgi:hypothetical protein
LFLSRLATVALDAVRTHEERQSLSRFGSGDHFKGEAMPCSVKLSDFRETKEGILVPKDYVEGDDSLGGKSDGLLNSFEAVRAAGMRTPGLSVCVPYGFAQEFFQNDMRFSGEQKNLLDDVFRLFGGAPIVIRSSMNIEDNLRTRAAGVGATRFLWSDRKFANSVSAVLELTNNRDARRIAEAGYPGLEQGLLIQSAVGAEHFVDGRRVFYPDYSGNVNTSRKTIAKLSIGKGLGTRAVQTRYAKVPVFTHNTETGSWSEGAPIQKRFDTVCYLEDFDCGVNTRTVTGTFHPKEVPEGLKEALLEKAGITEKLMKFPPTHGMDFEYAVVRGNIYAVQVAPIRRLEGIVSFPAGAPAVDSVVCIGRKAKSFGTYFILPELDYSNRTAYGRLTGREKEVFGKAFRELRSFDAKSAEGYVLICPDAMVAGEIEEFRENFLYNTLGWITYGRREPEEQSLDNHYSLCAIETGGVYLATRDSKEELVKKGIIEAGIESGPGVFKKPVTIAVDGELQIGGVWT